MRPAGGARDRRAESLTNPGSLRATVFGSALVTLMVDDLARSIRFYRDTLGFGCAAGEDGETAEFEGPALRLRIHRRRPEIDIHGSGTSAIGLSVADLGPVAAALRARGVHVGRTIRAGPRRIALFDDPDGNHWYLFDTAPPAPGRDPR